MNELLQIIWLAIVQGISEFLPISSSGHLVIFQHVFGWEDADENLLVVVVLHAGTLGAIITYYFKDLLALLARDRWNTVAMIIVGTLPLVVLGLGLKKLLDDHFGNLTLVTFCYFLTAAILLLLHRRPKEPKPMEKMTVGHAIFIGIMQCVAVLPGVSRSGSTISAATRMGYGHEDAARFSFFLGIPAIGGATLIEMLDMFTEPAKTMSTSLLSLVVGFVVSFVVGYFSLAFLIATLRKGRFSYFGYYCLALAVGLTIYQLFSPVS